MDLFLSWSTPRSKNLANIFNKWITKVIPQLEVYYSPEDIQPGERWSDSIKDGLKGNPMGLFFVVEENIVQPWLNFEAGAISNQVGNTNVIPILHDVEPSRITGPLTQFQAISYSKADLKRLVNLINGNITDVRKIDTIILNDIFEKWYPDFENQYEKFRKDYPSPEAKEISGTLDDSGQLSEILSILRSMERSDNEKHISWADNRSELFNYETIVSNGIHYNIDFHRNDMVNTISGETKNGLYIHYAKDFKRDSKKEVGKVVRNLLQDLERLPTCHELSVETEIPVYELMKFIRYSEIPF